MDMRSHEMVERRRDDNGNNGVGNISSIANEDNVNGNNTRVSCNSQTLDHHQSKSPSSFAISAAAKTAVRYRECLKNHAANVGGSVHDGCGEFMPSGEEGTIEALRCAACDCHRNFHRKEVDGVGSSDVIAHHHRQHHHQYGGGGGGRRPPPPNMMLNPLMLPPPPSYTPMHHHKYGMSPPGGAGMVTPMSVAYGGGGGGGGGAESSSEDLNMYGQSSGEHGGGGGATAGQMAFSMSSKKRFRTKFTTEQKERMMEFAEKLGWRMNKQDEEELKRFCGEIGVKRQVFKVWMHNNKNNARKPPPSTVTGSTL
ncbi:Zinc-finger homeodomain protein 5 [Raphanus sativus]|uniref:Zinc-finger homeodomain protein 5 n=1 Tax=Raphanus sativus TaxID=3726 RepID=A0A6J0KCZ4_RAPSA|nr:zinc-finger homeodomain protein 5 [Raphanus sativus]KAJ4883823.1 Zinc-finger homeodomain protein 5 [Raphanus sativus]